MEGKVLLTADNEEEAWARIDSDLRDTEILQYEVVIDVPGRKILLDIDIDLGGGFEGGYATTSFCSVLKQAGDFRFNIHNQGFIDGIGKLLGMQDVVIGYPEFDRKLIVKANDEQRVKALFTDETVRNTLQELEDYSFGITVHDEQQEIYLELVVEEGIKDPLLLRKIYDAYCFVLDKLEHVL